MTQLEIILLCFCIILFILTSLFAFLLNHKNKQIINLTKSIDNFLQNGKLTEFSTKDGITAHLQTNICELQHLLLLEKSNTANETKKNSEFISDISHQLKTPLAGLRLYCEMEHALHADEYTTKTLELISKMENLIYNVLKLEKIKNNTYTINFEMNKLDVIANDIINEISLLFPKKCFSIQGNGEFRCDKLWIYEAFENIVKNACEHTAENGKIAITIEQTQKSVNIIIEDDGGGVQEDELPKLFNRFHRTKNALQSNTGIGLSITKAIVQKHHGTICAENGTKGLRISVYFPIIDANLKL